MQGAEHSMNMYRFHDPALVARTRTGLFALMGLGTLAAVTLGLWLAWSTGQTIADLQSRIDRVSTLSPAEAPAGDEMFLAAESPNIAQTRLQPQIQEIAAAHALEIDIIRSEEIADQGRRLHLGVTLNGVIPEDRFAGFLTDLEAATPKILVDSYDLRRTRVTSRRDTTRKLALRMGLKGMMRK